MHTSQQQLSAQFAIQRYLELLYVLVERNLSARYRGSFLGIYWSTLNPLIMTAVYTTIFGSAFRSYYNNSLPNYVLASFTALVVINFFSAATSQALNSIVSNGSLLNKVSLPLSIFPVSMIAANLFQFSIGVLPILVVVTLLKSGNLINVFALLLPLTSLCFTALGFGFILSALYVFFRDLPYFYEIFVFILLMSSPVFYPAEIVPSQVRSLVAFNPLVSVIESIRQISLSGSLPDLSLIAVAWLSSLIVLGISWVIFKNWRDHFMDLL